MMTGPRAAATATRGASAPTVAAGSVLVMRTAVLRHARRAGASLRAGHLRCANLQAARAFSVVQEDNVTEADMAPEAKEEAKAHEVRLMMAAAMNATVLSFRVPEYKTNVGNRLAIVGSIEELGMWSAHAGARMKWSPGHSWACDVILPPAYAGSLEYKVVLLNDKGMCVWEPGPNRKLQLPGAQKDAAKKPLELTLHWGVREPTLTDDGHEEIDVELAVQRAAEAADLLPGRSAASVMLQAQQQMSESKARHRRQVSELREQLVSLQQSSAREVERVAGRMAEVEAVMEKLQARLDKERAVHEAQITLLQAKIRADDFPAKVARRAGKSPRVLPKSAPVVPGPAPDEEPAAAAPAAPDAPGSLAVSTAQSWEEFSAAADLTAYEGHVMAVLPHYSGLSVQRLHAMLQQVELEPRYTASEAQLGAYLSTLVTQGKLSHNADTGIFRFQRSGHSPRDLRAGSPRPVRAGSPRPAHAPVAAPATASTTRSHRETPRPVSALAMHVEEEDVAALQPHVLNVLRNYAGLTLDRLLSMVRVAASGCSAQQLTAVMRQLEARGLVSQERGVYRHRASADTDAAAGPLARARRTGTPVPASALAQLAHPSSSSPSSVDLVGGGTPQLSRTPRRRTPTAARGPVEVSGGPQGGTAAPAVRPHRVGSPRATRMAVVEDVDDRYSSAPSGSVAGGPPGSVSGAAHVPAKLSGTSIMPSFDSTGAHPTLSSVEAAQQPVLQTLARMASSCSLDDLHLTLQATQSGWALSKTELAAVLKNLTDQHRVRHLDGTYTFLSW